MRELPCLNCIHVPVCEHKNLYREYFEKPLSDVLNRMPDFLSVNIECKFYKTKDDFIPTIRHESLTRLHAKDI